MTTGSPIKEIRGEHERAEAFDRAKQNEELLVNLTDLTVEELHRLEGVDLSIVDFLNQAQLAKAKPIIEKQQQAKDTEYYAEMMKIAVDRVRRVAEKQKGEEIHDMATGQETRTSDKGSIWVRFPTPVWQGLKKEE